MSFVTAALIGAGGAVLGGAIASSGASRAAKTQAAAADRAAELQNQQFERQIQLQEPWRQAGINALGRLQSGDIMSYQDPSYQFRLSEGLKALDRTASARGGLLSGGALKAAQRYGQDYASQEYGNIWNRLAGLAGVGQTATNQLGQAGQTMAGNVGNLMTSGANARASGYVGGANALNQAIGGVGNAYMQSQILNRLYPTSTTPNYGWSGTSLNQTFGGTGGIGD